MSNIRSLEVCCYYNIILYNIIMTCFSATENTIWKQSKTYYPNRNKNIITITIIIIISGFGVYYILSGENDQNNISWTDNIQCGGDPFCRSESNRISIIRLNHSCDDDDDDGKKSYTYLCILSMIHLYIYKKAGGIKRMTVGEGASGRKNVLRWPGPGKKTCRDEDGPRAIGPDSVDGLQGCKA